MLLNITISHHTLKQNQSYFIKKFYQMSIILLHWWTCIFVQQVFSKMFLLIDAPSENDIDTNDTSLESPINGLLKARSKLGMAPSYGLPHPLE